MASDRIYIIMGYSVKCALSIHADLKYEQTMKVTLIYQYKTSKIKIMTKFVKGYKI
jgi:hypothetical protein